MALSDSFKKHYLLIIIIILYVFGVLIIWFLGESVINFKEGLFYSLWSACILLICLLGSYLNKASVSEINTPCDSNREIISIEEVKALIRYASDQGLDIDTEKKEKQSILSELTVLVVAWEEEKEKENNIRYEELSKIIVLYAQLNCITEMHVTGKSIRDSLKVDEITIPVRNITWLLVFPLILLNVFLEGWFQDIVDPEEGILFFLINFQRYILDYLTPFLWGAMGSCVYLLKVFNDLAESKKFNEDKMRGWGTRITLGAILGGVVQFIYDESAFGSSGVNLDANAIGFLTGIGVKVVYGAMEKTIEQLSTLMNLDSLKSDKKDNSEIRRYLNEKNSTLTDSESDKNKRIAIQELLSDLNKPT